MMKAAICYEFGKPVVVEEVDIDPPHSLEDFLEPDMYDTTDEPGLGVIDSPAWVGPAIDSVGALVLNNYIKICAPKGHEDSSIYESMVRAVGVWGRIRLGE